MQFEYHIYNSFQIGGQPEAAILAELNRLGSLGWELVSNPTEFRYVFKRQIKL